MSAQKKQKPIEKLMALATSYAVAQGHAEWTNGYRAAQYGLRKGRPIPAQDAEDRRLFDKEIRQWKLAGEAQKAFRRLALKLLREAKKELP